MVTNKSIPERFTLTVLDMLPSVNCVTPKRALSLTKCDTKDLSNILMDGGEFMSESVQRVYQYLRRHAANYNLDRFSYSQGSVEESPFDCLQIVLR